MATISKSSKTRSAYHVTHLDNLEGVCRERTLLPANLANPVTNFADSEIKRKRREFKLGVEPFGVLADYTPFYFASTTPFFFHIANDQNSQRPATRQAHFVIIRLNFDPHPDALINGSPSIVTSAHPLSSEVQIAKASPENINKLINWQVIGSKTPWDVKGMFEEEWRLRRQAELLVFGGLKLDGADIKLFVRSDAALEKVDKILDEFRIECESAIGERYFNHHHP